MTDGAELADCARNAAALGSAPRRPWPSLAEPPRANILRGARNGAGEWRRQRAFRGRARASRGHAMPRATAVEARFSDPESLAPCPHAQRFARQGIEAPVTTGLQRVLDGEASAEQWLESVRNTTPRARTRAA